jgi:hypothetical protein
LRQLIAAERAGKHVGQIEHPRRREKSSHSCTSLFCVTEYLSV